MLYVQLGNLTNRAFSCDLYGAVYAQRLNVSMWLPWKPRFPLSVKKKG